MLQPDEVTQCAYDDRVFWTNGYKDKDFMLEGAASWTSLEDYDLSLAQVKHLYVHYRDHDGNDTEDWGDFMECRRDDDGAFLVTRLSLEMF